MDTIKTIKYEPITKVFAVIFLSILFIPLDILVVPINNSFKNMLLFIPITIPTSMLFVLNALFIIVLNIIPTKFIFLIILYREILMKNIHMNGTILFNVFFISLILLVIKSIDSIKIIIVNKWGFINNVFYIVLVCIIKKNMLYVVINIINIIIAKTLFLRPNFV